MADAPVKIFVMSDNVWRDENEWPLARTVYTAYYLHSAGGANTRAGRDQPPPLEPPRDPTLALSRLTTRLADIR